MRERIGTSVKERREERERVCVREGERVRATWRNCDKREREREKRRERERERATWSRNKEKNSIVNFIQFNNKA